jgi:hypothetical protein
MSGPEEVVAGASFQVTVANRQTESLRTVLIYDPTVLSAAGTGTAGSLPVELAGQATQVFTFSIKPDASPSATTLNLASGGASWTVQVGSATPAQPEPTPEPADESR